jgi:hypothetical protein
VETRDGAFSIIRMPYDTPTEDELAFGQVEKLSKELGLSNTPEGSFTSNACAMTDEEGCEDAGELVKCCKLAVARWRERRGG